MNHAARISVCMLTTSFPRFEGDMAGRPVYELCRELSQSAHITVLAPHAPGFPKQEQMAGCFVHRFRYFWPERLERLAYGSAGIPANLRNGLLPKAQVLPLVVSFLIQAFHRCIGCDIIHAHFAPSAVIGAAVKAVTRKPLVITLRGTGARLLAGPVLKALLRRADAVISPHPELTRLAASCGCARIDEIPNPIDLSRFSPLHGALATDASRLNDRPVVVFVGRLVDFKDPETFVRSVPFVRKRLPRAHFCVVGDGPLLPRLKALADSLGCSGCVEFTGYDPDVLPHLRRASVYVACSPVENVWSNSLVEAMSCGLPCVVTDVGFSRQELEPSGAAVLVKPRDPEGMGLAISGVLADPDRASQLGEGARGLVAREGFSKQAVGAATLRLYERLLAVRADRTFKERGSPPAATAAR